MPVIRLPQPHTGQRIVRSEAKRFNWIAAGRRWRKTTLFMAAVCEACMAGQQIVWGAPVFDQVFTGWLELKKAAHEVAHFNQSRMTAEFPTGGRVIFRSLDNPDNARSKTADGLVIDEAADVADEAWYEVLRPMLMDTGGWAWIGGTPKGRNWFWREFMAARDRDDSTARQAPTLGAVITPHGLVRQPHPLENPNIEFSELLQMYRTMPERTFRQEILAEFIEDAGGVFRGVLDAAIAPYPAEPRPGTYVMGVDWGREHDFTVCVVMDTASRQVVDLDRFNQIGWGLQRGRLSAMATKWNPTVIVAEQNSIGAPNIEELQRSGLPVRGFVTTNETKSEIIEALVLSIETRAISYPNDATLVAELQAYEMERLPSGRIRYGAPAGVHDDCVMALALANWASGQQQAPIYGPDLYL